MAININVENYNSNTYYTGENFSGATDFNFTNPADSTSYVIFQTISIDEKYTSVSPKNFLGTITNSTVVDTVVSPYVLAIVLPPGTSTFTFTPDTAVTGTTYNFRVSRRGAFQPNPPPPPTPSIDPDAEAFLTAAAITDATITSAVDTLVTDLKTANIWTKMKAIYPMVGGSATTHKWNLKNPLDTDAAFRLVFNGGWTHSSTGALPNGTNGYANTFFNLSTGFTSANKGSAGGYWRTALPNAGYFFGVNTPVAGASSRFWIRPVSGFKDHYAGGTTLLRDNTVTNYSGFSAMCRRSTTDMFAIKEDGTYITLATSVTTAFSNSTLPFAAVNASEVIGTFSNAEIALGYISDDITQAEMTNLRTAIITFQTTLGRQV
jgi:hypothetical protein